MNKTYIHNFDNYGIKGTITEVISEVNYQQVSAKTLEHAILKGYTELVKISLLMMI